MALQTPETPEGPGWCGQGAARGQHGPDMSGVASQRPNRLRGLSVEGRCLSPDRGKRQGRTAQTINRHCQTPGRKDPERGREHVNIPHMIAATVPSIGVSAAVASRLGLPNITPLCLVARLRCSLRSKGMIVTLRRSRAPSLMLQ